MRNRPDDAVVVLQYGRVNYINNFICFCLFCQDFYRGQVFLLDFYNSGLIMKSDV